MKFLHAADIHLDSPLKGLEQYEGAPVEEIRGATRRALSRMVDLALEEEVDFVLIAGDLYDGDWKDHNTGLYFVSQIARLREAEIPVVMIRGNHDAENKMTRSLPLPPNVSTLSSSLAETKLLEQSGAAIHGRSFSKAKETANLAVDYPAAHRGLFNIGLLHTSLTGAEHHEPYAPCSVGDLEAKEYQYWALGHVHTRAEAASDTPIVFPGNIQGRHARELGAKGCILVEVDDRGAVHRDFRPLDVLRWAHAEIDCTAAQRGDDVLDACERRLAALLDEYDGLPLAVRVSLRGATPAHQQLLAGQEDWANQIRAAAINAGGGRIWIEKVRFRTRPSGALDKLLAGDGPLGELVTYIRNLQNDPQELASLADELAPLIRKLPAELKQDPEPLQLDQPEYLAELLAEVEPLLVSRLQSQEARS